MVRYADDPVSLNIGPPREFGRQKLAVTQDGMGMKVNHALSLHLVFAKIVRGKILKDLLPFTRIHDYFVLFL
jgi:hypothetical protein